MRNLLGRLHARSSPELARIAAFWQVPVASGDRHAQVGALYRVLIDPRAARSAWDRLAPDERAIVRLLAIGESDAAPTLRELAARLDRTESAVRETAIRLYRIGILTREGDDDPLPVGAEPRLFLPRELALVFRRIQDEIEAGDLSNTPLRALLELFDDAEVEESAAIWGIRVVPGLRERPAITKRLLQQITDPARVAAIAARQHRDATQLWQQVREAAAPVPLATAAAAIGLDGDDPRIGQRLRRALAELETALLVWHTYRPDGSRWLFIPNEIRSPRPFATPDLPPLAPIAAATLTPPPFRPPDALAWDLLTLVRELAQPGAPRWPKNGAPPRSRLRGINRRLWHQEAEVPPLGYLDLLIALATAEGLVTEEGATGEETLEAEPRSPALRRWRERSFAAQSERLQWWWLASSEWIEGRARDEVEVWGADWRGARRKLLALLAAPEIGLAVETWYTMESVAARIAAHEPDLLGLTFTAATARQTDSADTRAAAIAEVVAIELTTAFAWFGLVELTDVPGHTRAVRVTESGRRLSQSAPRSEAPPVDEPPGPPLTITDAGEIALHRPSPLRVWSLSAFADLVQLDQISRYRLSAEALTRALAAGFDLDHVTAFLTRQSGAALPEPVAAQLATWARRYQRVRLRHAIILAPDDPAAVEEISRIVAEAGLTSRPLGPSRLLIELSADEPESMVQTLTDRLRAAGYAPHWEAPPPVAPGDEVKPIPNTPKRG